MASRIKLTTGSEGRQAYQDLRSEYRAALVAPLDDMWATFADEAEPLGIELDGGLAGCASVDDAGRLQHLFVRSDFEDRAAACLSAIVDARDVRSVVASTVDPGALSIALSHCQGGSAVALMYHHQERPDPASSLDLHRATKADHRAAVEFMVDGTGAPRSWTDGYLAERIELGELQLHVVDGEILGAGELRIDRRAPGYAQLGLVVGADRRSRGLGSQIMSTLVEVCDRDGLIPLCSTEPDNHAAQKVIRRAGFRSRHRVFELTPPSAQ